MSVAFSRGQPRNGQWVLVDGKTLGIAVEPDRAGSFVTIGDVITRFPDPHDPVFKSQVPDPSRWRVDVVDQDGVFTLGSLLVKLGRLEPVTDLGQIPAKRRATCMAGWAPRP